MAQYDRREQEFGEELMRQVERYVLLEIIDQRWREHLYDMDYLREGIHLRGLRADRAAGRLQERGVRAVPRPDELDLDRLRAADLPRRGHADGPRRAAARPPAPVPAARSSPRSSSATGGGRVTYSGGGVAQGAGRDGRGRGGRRVENGAARTATRSRSLAPSSSDGSTTSSSSAATTLLVRVRQEVQEVSWGVRVRRPSGVMCGPGSSRGSWHGARITPEGEHTLT